MGGTPSSPVPAIRVEVRLAVPALIPTKESVVAPEPHVHDGTDRVAPTIRPDRRAVMRQDWHHLLFLHWSIPAEQLRPSLPTGLELDLYEGRAYVGLTPFTMTGVRPAWIPPIPFVSSFHETNVRTYVHAGGRDPGVWFFSLDASSTLAVIAARTLLGLPYRCAQIDMAFERAALQAAPVIDYKLRRRWPGPTPASCAVRYAPRGPVSSAVLGSLEYFLVERYVLYNAARGQLYRGRIHHAPWPLQGADVPALDETLLAAAGIARPDEPPLAHYGREVRVEIFAAERVGPGGRPEA
jgi:uncharacterized protein